MTLQLGSHGPLVSRWTQVMLKRFKSYALGVNGLPLVDDGYYGYDEQKVQLEYERRTNQTQDGIVSDHDLGALGLAQAVYFSVEGHMSNMWLGPAADTARLAAAQTGGYWQPYGYVNDAIPFANTEALNGLVELLEPTSLPDGTPFPAGTPFNLTAFSQGSMIGTMLLRDELLNPNGRLHWRLPDYRRSLFFGNPNRGKDQICSWAPRPPAAGTGGIMLPQRWSAVGTACEAGHRESANAGDMFADEGEDTEAKNKAAIAEIVCSNSWSGGDVGLLQRLEAIVGNIPAQAIPLTLSIISAIKFAVANPNPHYSTVSTPGDVAWMAGL